MFAPLPVPEVARARLLEEGRRLQEAGVFALDLELVTPEVAREVTADLSIPTIGIGAGPECDGQILVLQDMLGMNLDFQPKFLKHFATLEHTVIDALKAYCREVETQEFPSATK